VNAPTPGPWVTREARYAIAVAQDGHMPHATVFERGPDEANRDSRVNDTARADAALMAAAPDLLHACEAAESALVEMGDFILANDIRALTVAQRLQASGFASYLHSVVTKARGSHA
jgi:hypothetical protein